MCGITGIFHYSKNQETNTKELITASNSLIHRGPDDSGTYLNKHKTVGLGFRRLAIIDLSEKGRQPMSNEDGTVWIVFNGEIYNYRELRPTLKARGHKFRSETDTEVIIHAYEEYGTDCVKHFNGMFAFALWDERKQLLFAARDHLGIKPFYYALQNGTLYFGSEIKAILSYPSFIKSLNEEGLSYYLTFSSLPSPHTLFSQVYKLPPAHTLTLSRNNEPVISEYWNPLRHTKEPLTETEYAQEIRNILKDSIKKQMVSDVPFGCFLSGGIDSSINAALMSEMLRKPVVTFSTGSRQYEKYNELEYSRLMAKKLGAQAHEILLDESDLYNFLPQYAKYADDPNGDQVCFPLYYLSKLTREKGTVVVQIGEGSDEIFAGYSTYLDAYSLYNKYWKVLQSMPQFIRTSMYKISNAFQHSKFDFWKEYLRRLSANQNPYWGNAIAFSEHQKTYLLTSDYQKKHSNTLTYKIIEKYIKEVEEVNQTTDFLKTMTYLEIKQRLAELLLMRADKMIMAHSVEGRVPFLDTRLVELAFSMPASLKFKNNEPKYILKKAVEEIIPNEIIYRKKQGFSTPINEWLKPNTKSAERLISIINTSKLKDLNALNYSYINNLIKTHQHQGERHGFRIWNLITLSLWYDHWF